MTQGEIPVRGAREEMADDIVQPFTVDTLNVRGRIARLGRSVQDAIAGHDYPEPVARRVAEIMALAALLGTTLKFSGKLIVQVQSDGPLHLLVADFTAPDRLRALARFDADRLKTAQSPQSLLGRGQLVITLDQGPHTRRYQGMVPLQGSLREAVERYFVTSEQLPTRVRLAAGQLLDASGAHWRAGAMMIQHLPPAGKKAQASANDEGWNTACALFDTLQDRELLDPTLSPERLVYRLYHEQGVRVFEPLPMRWRCGCSRETLKSVIGQFPAEAREEMLEEDGKIRARCEFCGSSYVFDPAEFTP